LDTTGPVAATRVVVGEDESLTRESLRLVLAREEFEVVGLAADADRLLELTRAELPDLVITDIRMPPRLADDGLQAALEIRRTLPDIAVAVLSHHLQRRYAMELLADRPHGIGYLLKQRIADVDNFRQDLLRVAGGGTALDPEVVALMVSRARAVDDAVQRLTPRQAEVLAHMAEGRSNGWIARHLVLTEKAVIQHVSNVYDTLGLYSDDDINRRVLAVTRYLSHQADRV